jgi:hypothetical protein
LAERLAALAPIHALVHNAGALATTYTRAPGGSEQTVTVHLLAPYLLTEHLLGVLQDAAPARVVVTTSGGMYTQRHCLADLEMSPADYRGPVAYARAKRAQVVLVDEWQRRYRRSGVDFFAVHPGWADTPGLRHGMPTFARWLGPALRTPEEGADTLAWLAAGGGQPGMAGPPAPARAPGTVDDRAPGGCRGPGGGPMGVVRREGQGPHSLNQSAGPGLWRRPSDCRGMSRPVGRALRPTAGLAQDRRPPGSVIERRTSFPLGRHSASGPRRGTKEQHVHSHHREWDLGARSCVVKLGVQVVGKARLRPKRVLFRYPTGARRVPS